MAGISGIMDKALEIIDKAISSGCNITADSGLYSAFPSYIGATILDDGWEAKYGENISEEKLLISSGIYAGEFCNREKFLYLREEFPYILITAFVCDENEIEKALKKPYIFVSTNAVDGPHYENVGHPETAGTFPKLIRKYVREEKTLTLIEALKKITLLPAIRFQIDRKGEIKEGLDADLVVFDYHAIADKADYVGFGDPNAPPVGIDHVIVNGDIILEQNNLNAQRRPGRFLSCYT